MGDISNLPAEREAFKARLSEIYPYLLRDVSIDRVDQVWSTDITYIRLKQGFIYLVVVIGFCCAPYGIEMTSRCAEETALLAMSCTFSYVCSCFLDNSEICSV